MKITTERIDQITNDRELHMLIGHVVVLATALKKTQSDIEKILTHLRLSDTGKVNEETN